MTLSFISCIDRCKMKNMQPLLLFIAGDGCLLSLSLSLSLSLTLSLSISLSLSFCLSFWLSVCLSLLCVCFYETNFPYKRGYSIAHSILKTCAQQRKDHLGLFLNINHLEEEEKKLIKLIVVDSNHFIRYKSNVKSHSLSLSLFLCLCLSVCLSACLSASLFSVYAFMKQIFLIKEDILLHIRF